MYSYIVGFYHVNSIMCGRYIHINLLRVYKSNQGPMAITGICSEWLPTLNPLCGCSMILDDFGGFDVL